MGDGGGRRDERERYKTVGSKASFVGYGNKARFVYRLCCSSNITSLFIPVKSFFYIGRCKFSLQAGCPIFCMTSYPTLVIRKSPYWRFYLA
jgi:hypothetical protein